MSHNANIPTFPMKSEEFGKVLTQEQETQSQQQVTKPSSPKKNGSKFSEKWTQKGTIGYRHFLQKSQNGPEYFYCKICKKDYKVSYLYGSNNHLKTKTHLENEKVYVFSTK